MSRLAERLERDLRQIADRATPSPNAWETIRARIAAQVPVEETEVIMLTDEPARVHRRWPILGLAAAAVIAVLALGIALLGRDDGPEVRAGAGATPEEVLASYVEAFNAHDLDAVMALFADDAIITGHPLDSAPPAEGTAEVRILESADMGTGNTYEMTNVEAAGDTVTFGHRWHRADGACFAGTDRMVVEQGKIAQWDFITASRPCE
jgi:hypothetical protein